jgi:hypothetical protein
MGVKWQGYAQRCFLELLMKKHVTAAVVGGGSFVTALYFA